MIQQTVCIVVNGLMWDDRYLSIYQVIASFLLALEIIFIVIHILIDYCKA